MIDYTYREEEEDDRVPPRSNEDLLALARKIRRHFNNCSHCQHSRDLHDETGCRAEWGNYNDREFCLCMATNPGNVVPNQGFDEDEV